MAASPALRRVEGLIVGLVAGLALAASHAPAGVAAETTPSFEVKAQ